eukprot:m.389188 g.389188  ORF g.389188 m.389188 type:complete len:95 (+) comp21048_c0_seq6:356-640(+)
MHCQRILEESSRVSVPQEDLQKATISIHPGVEPGGAGACHQQRETSVENIVVVEHRRYSAFVRKASCNTFHALQLHYFRVDLMNNICHGMSIST